MNRVLRLQVEIPKIEMVDGLGVPQDYWVPSEEDALTFALDEEKFVGIISLYLDPEAVALDWDTHDWETVLEYPLSCTQIAVVVEAECDETATEREFLAMAQRQTHRHVNSILAQVRVDLGQYWVRSLPLSALYLVSFVQETKARWLHGDSETPVLEGIQYLGDQHPLAADYYELVHSRESLIPFVPLTKDAWEDIQSSPVEQHHSLKWELVGNARHHFSTMEYRTAAVEAVTALEVGLSSFVRERSKRTGVRRTPAADHRGLRVAACLTKHLPSLLGEHELDTWLNTQRSKGRHLPAPFARLRDDLDAGTLLSRCVQLNTLRNKIVHEGRVPDEKDIDTIQEGIEAAEWLLAFTQGCRQQS
ncbi:MAG TPA: hypothetical protein VM075_11605 [Anaerolineae bacterium]|nr:hypothetical protein [Anaerolineae bacterium]